MHVTVCIVCVTNYTRLYFPWKVWGFFPGVAHGGGAQRSEAYSIYSTDTRWSW